MKKKRRNNLDDLIRKWLMNSCETSAGTALLEISFRRHNPGKNFPLNKFKR